MIDTMRRMGQMVHHIRRLELIYNTTNSPPSRNISLEQWTPKSSLEGAGLIHV